MSMFFDRLSEGHCLISMIFDECLNDDCDCEDDSDDGDVKQMAEGAWYTHIGAQHFLRRPVGLPIPMVFFSCVSA